MSASTDKKLRREAREAGTDKWSKAEKEAAEKEAKKNKQKRITLIVVAVLLVFIILLNSGFMYNVPAAAKVGGQSYSAAEVQYYYANQFYSFYNTYGSYASYFGLDLTYGMAGLASQEYAEGESWKDHFLESAMDQLVQIKALCDYAKANGIALDADDTADIDAEIAALDTYAAQNGYSNTNKFVNAYYGEHVSKSVVRSCMEDTALASKAYNAKLDSFEYSDAELKEHYASFEGAQDKYSYSYYCVYAEEVESTDAEGNTSSDVTDETMADAKATAEQILAAYETAEGATEFEKLSAAVAEIVPDAAPYESSGISGSSLGSYYSEWVMNSSRKAGDATVTEYTGNGYYVVVFSGRDNNEYNLVNVRHILISAEADENGEYTDEAKGAALAKILEIENEWKTSDMTEETFAALAEQYSEDTGSNTNGGLYENVYKGEMVEEFNDFLFNSGAKAGDTKVVYGSNGNYAGYHLVYFAGEGPMYCDYIAKSDLQSTAMSEWLEEVTATCTAEAAFAMRFVG